MLYFLQKRETDRERERRRGRERLLLLLTGTPRTPSAGAAWLMTDTEGTNRSPCSYVTVPVSMLQWVINSQRVHKGYGSFERVTQCSCVYCSVQYIAVQCTPCLQTDCHDEFGKVKVRSLEGFQWQCIAMHTINVNRHCSVTMSLTQSQVFGMKVVQGSTQ